MSTIEALRADAARLLKDGAVKMVIGYRARGDDRVPAFVTDPLKVDSLVYDSACKQNLAAYLSKPQVRRLVPLGLVAPPNVCRSLSSWRPKPSSPTGRSGSSPSETTSTTACWTSPAPPPC
jgi:hypothetical protein